MAEILKDWLAERLEYPISWESAEFGTTMRNGFIVAGVLYSYHIINEEQKFLIRSSNSPEEIKNNWKYLHEWLLGIDLNLTKAELENIMDGQSGEMLRLFYKLFLCLDKRDRTSFIKRERKMVSGLVEKPGHRFKVDKITEDEESFVDDLSKPLLNERYFIAWQKKKTEEIKRTYDYIRHRQALRLKKVKESGPPLCYRDKNVKKLSSKDKMDMENFALRYPCKFESYKYEDLLDLERNALEHKQSLTDSDWARNYIENLQTRFNKKSDTEQFQRHLTNTITGELWDKTVAEEESNFDTELAKKVMKLSQFEKQMCTQIMEAKQQARNLVRNRIRAERDYTNQRTLQFNQFLDMVKEQIHLECEEIDFEKKRQNMLHKKLYEEKMRRKRLHYYEICYETMLSIVDYAVKYSHFTELLQDTIPERFIHEWKVLYFKHQPIWDIVTPTENILEEAIEEQEPELEEVTRLELIRQEALNENEFIEYHNYSHPWTLHSLIPNYDPESEDRKYEYLGNRILGHVVYSLLEMKYPSPPPLPSADLPEYTAKALLLNLSDLYLTVPIQILLNASKIHVVRLETALNYCLRQYKYEMVGIEDVELSYDKFVTASQDENQKELIKLMKTDDEAGAGKASELAVLAMLGGTPANTKQTQTPKVLPEEEIGLSKGADLGRWAYEVLTAGDTLTDYLIAATIVEYLRDKDDINGFVIINYPNNYMQAQILEETMTGIGPPAEKELVGQDDVYLEETIEKHRLKVSDPYKEIRISKLVSNPHKKKIEQPFKSYFTSYIRLKECEDILQEYVIWDLTEENSELIDRFYATLGMNYSIYYDAIDKDFLAKLCQYIIGDIVPEKSTDELFGENVLSELDFLASVDKRTKMKVSKPEVGEEQSRERLHKALNSFSGSKKNISEQNVEEEEKASIEGEETHEEIPQEEVEVILLAGEEDWEYGVLPFSDLIGVALATYWEEIEKAHIYDMQQLFFAIRLQMNCLVPYTTYIKEKIEQAIIAPSGKQELVSNFQKCYNDYESDWRDITLSKNEWHCRIKDLQLKLYEICDQRKLNNQRIRRELILDNWAMDELTTMVNNYISCMQSELNRFYLTNQTFNDFYLTMLKRVPPTDKLISKDLTKILREPDDASGSKKGAEDKVFRQLKTAFLDLQLKNIDIDFSNNPFNLFIENNVKFALKAIKDTNDSLRNVIAREYGEVAKIQSQIVKKKDEVASAEEDEVNPEEIFKFNGFKCIDEWIMGVNGEMFRATLRIQALQQKCYRDMRLFNDYIYRTFTRIQEAIDTYYMSEIRAVDRLCKYLQMAVEKGLPIPETLKVEKDTFTIDPNLLQFAPIDISSGIDDSKEMVKDSQFKISQLARLRSQFKIVAPSGLTLQQAFIYLLQDFVCFGKESCEGAQFPDSWARIDPEQLPKFVFSLFGETMYVDWRDFLIYCLNITFPTVEELLTTRENFRCNDLESTELISRENYMHLELWFENEFNPDDNQEQLRKVLIKHFLFELFETKEDMMNYSAFLLAFSKNADPIAGFATAISMVVGKKTCYCYEECKEIIENLIKLKEYLQSVRICALNCASEFIDNLIINVIDYCEGTTITELLYEPTDDKKSKKGKGKQVTPTKPGKKGDSSIISGPTSTTGKMRKSVSKIEQPEKNIKTTYICPPCQVESEGEEKLAEHVEAEEEREPQPDRNIAYSVPQSVIWKVLCICLPWYFEMEPEAKKTPFVDQVNEVIKKLEVDTENGDVYLSKFVGDPMICKMLHKVKKFTALDVTEEIKKIYE